MGISFKKIKEGLNRNVTQNFKKRANTFKDNIGKLVMVPSVTPNADQGPASTADPSTKLHPRVQEYHDQINNLHKNLGSPQALLPLFNSAKSIFSNLHNFNASDLTNKSLQEDSTKTTAQFSGINLNDIAGTTKFILNTLLSLLGKVFSMVGPSIFGAGHKAITQLFNENFKITPDIIGNLTTQIKSLAVNDENRAAIENLAAETVTVIATLTPYLEKVIKQVLESAGDIAKKEAAGLTGLGFNVLASAIAEIPIIGGIIDLLLAFVRASNSVLKIWAKVMGTGAKIVGLGVEGATDVTENLATKVVEPSAPPSDKKQTGGGAMKKHQAIKKEIQSTIRRLQHRFKHFRKTRRRQQQHRGGGGGV